MGDNFLNFLQNNGLTYSDDLFNNSGTIEHYLKVLKEKKFDVKDYDFFGFEFPHIDIEDLITEERMGF